MIPLLFFFGFFGNSARKHHEVKPEQLKLSQGVKIDLAGSLPPAPKAKSAKVVK